MATKAQRKAQKAKRQNKKRQKSRLRDKQRRSQTPATRIQLRLAKQSVRPWNGECIEDLAVIDDQSLQTLTTEMAAQARAVRQALAAVCAGQSQQPLESLSSIGRNSPFAAWRLFLRGLVAWQNRDFDAAQQSWKRLDRERRPGRIATAMMLARRDDLETLSRFVNGADSADAGDSTDDPWTVSLDTEVLYHAKLLRRVHLDRSAIRIARAAAKIPEDFENMIDDALIGPRRIGWLREFTKEYQAMEPELVQALHHVALHRACCGPYVDMFAEAKRHFAGPRHDRKNNLLTFFFESAADDPRSKAKAKQALDQYLTVDLPGNRELSPQLRDALISQVHLNEAMTEMMPNAPMMGGMFSFFNDGPDAELIEDHFRRSIDAYPKNRLAYESYVEWIETLIADGQMKKAGRDALADVAGEVRGRWARELPDDIEPRLALVDYLLENDKSDEAKTHVDFLSGVRQDNPLARAMHWKWSLLEAMRLCRRKAWLAEVPHRLDEAQQRWPGWLGDDWLPYLRAGYDLRCGDHDRFQTQLQAGRAAASVTENSIQDACMTLAAAQRMRVPAADLKPLRQPIDRVLENLDTIDDGDLLATASFFWDLSRASLLYPAFRNHGTKFLRELLDRLRRRPSLVHDDLDDPLVQSALFVMSDQGVFNDSYRVNLPNWLDKTKSKSHITLAATETIAVLNRSVNWGAERYAGNIPVLREAASRSDAFYRHWFNTLADDLEEEIRESNSSDMGGLGGFARMFGDLLESEGGDPNCDCEDCRRARGEI